MKINMHYHRIDGAWSFTCSHKYGSLTFVCNWFSTQNKQSLFKTCSMKVTRPPTSSFESLNSHFPLRACFQCEVKQISNQPITWQQLSHFEFDTYQGNAKKEFSIFVNYNRRFFIWLFFFCVRRSCPVQLCYCPDS